MELCPGRCLALIAITALHAVLAVVLTLYPSIVPSNAYDGMYATVALLIVVLIYRSLWREWSLD